MAPIDYAASGVNIDEGNKAVEMIRPLAASTHNPRVLKGIGSFASFYDIGDIAASYKNPVMVQSTDGVGTKITVCNMAGDYATIGKDLFAACANDIVVHGARPATFLDYIANERLSADTVAQIVRGLCECCREHDVALVGGETAEMPGTYVKDEHDLVGFVTGFVERDKIINGESVIEGDAVLGIASTGLHTNGFSLARKVLFDIGKKSLNDMVDAQTTIAQALLAPHAVYVKSVLELLEQGFAIKAMAHITGGGLLENIPRVLPEGLRARLYPSSWPRLPIFDMIQSIGSVENSQMYRTFNMGIGLVLIVDHNRINEVLNALKETFTLDAYLIGSIEKGGPLTYIDGISAHGGELV